MYIYIEIEREKEREREREAIAEDLPQPAAAMEAEPMEAAEHSNGRRPNGYLA